MNALLCHQDGFTSWVTTDLIPFENVGDCVSYAAGGGTLTPPNASQFLCESFGGTFGYDVHVIWEGSVVLPDPPASTLWVCAGIPLDPVNFRDDFQAKAAALRDACVADGGNVTYGLANDTPVWHGGFFCGVSTG